MLKLYTYFRSSASYRVRIALNWKRLDFETLPVHLLKNGGQQNTLEYRRLNPMGHVPALDDNGFLVTESMAILDYLDRKFPQQPLFPQAAERRAEVMQICEMINSGIQPIHNLKVNQFLEKEFGLQKVDIEKWNKHWIFSGLSSLEQFLSNTAGNYCVGDTISAADAFLVPQCFSARRFGVDTKSFPIIHRLDLTAAKLDEFERAHPENQPDYFP